MDIYLPSEGNVSAFLSFCSQAMGEAQAVKNRKILRMSWVMSLDNFRTIFPLTKWEGGGVLNFEWPYLQKYSFASTSNFNLRLQR